MKLIIENFRRFLTEQNFISDFPLETDEEGNVILYHVSGAEDIEELDPDVAAKKSQELYNSKNTEVGIDQEFSFLLVSDKKIQALVRFKVFRIVLD